ncbi:MAG: STAS domain-containing protein [Planctomycetota bacterium]|jgi:anti-anti-sigma regulatory factor
MSADNNGTDYEISGGILSVHKSMLHDRDLDFDRICRELLDQEEVDLLIDLSRANYINSTYVGIIAATFFQASARKKTLSLRTSGALAEVLRVAGFEEFISIEVVEAV